MKQFKRTMALLLMLVMALSLFSGVAFADGESNEATAPIWPNEGAINLSKTAQPVDGKDGIYEVTLTIEGKNYKTTSDVVLVIDCSGSMDGSKLTNTRKAAKAFGEKLLTEGSTTRIAIVTYVDEATAYNSGHFYTASELDAFKSAVDKATYANGGTNQQAGIHVAQQLLTSAASTGKQKNIVILSDGEPTYSYPFTGGDLGKHNDLDFRSKWISSWPSVASPDYSRVIGSGGSFSLSEGNIGWSWHNALWSSYNLYGSFYYDANGNFVCSKGSKSSDNGVATIWEANQAKAAGTNIFSVALQAGTNGEKTLKACASDAAKNYYAIASNDNVETKLTSAFEAIAGSIAIAASNGSVTDPMSDYVDLAFENDPIVTNDEGVFKAEQANVYLSQGTVSRNGETLNWNVGNINEGSPAVMKYRVKLNANAVKGGVYPTNDTTTFSYTDYQGNQTSKNFDIPQVTPNGGTILMHFYRVNADGQPVNADGVVVDSPDKAEKIAEDALFSYNGSTALDYGTYSVERADISGYYGYVLDGVMTKDAITASVTLSTTDANRDAWFAYRETFDVAHVQNGKVVATESHDVVAGFDLTAQTSDGYLYGGSFESDYTTAINYGNENPTSFTPVAGKTYYIWEVPESYLKPKSMSAWEHKDATTVDVIGFYMMSVIDRVNYKDAGFVASASNGSTAPITDIGEGGTKLTSSTVYDSVVVTFKNGSTRTLTAENLTGLNGYIVCYAAPKAYWTNAGDQITFIPYWVTLDGVKVTGISTRTCQYEGAGPDTDSKHTDVAPIGDDVIGASVITVEPATAITTLNLRASYALDGSQYEQTPVEPVEPSAPVDSEPVEPTEPTAPVEPEQPVEPAEPEEPATVTLTVNDNGNVNEITSEPGDFSGLVSYGEVYGSVFAGWYADEALSVPANLNDIQENTTVYAKYVSGDYLQVKYIEQRFSGSVYLMSAVDNSVFADAGYIINGEYVSCNYFTSRYSWYTTSYLFNGVGRNAQLMLKEYALGDMNDGDTLSITPYWVTLDGTYVYGVNRVLTYNSWYGLQG